MPYKPDHKEKTHRRIVEEAAKEFRTHGFEGIGIARLMSALKLTHGGFYAHFADKEALVAEASTAALDQSLATMLAALETGGVAAVLDYYLSEPHRDHPELGCPLPALAADMARRTHSSRDAFTRELARALESVAQHIPGRTHAQRIEKTLAMFSSTTGAIALARAVSDPGLSRSILRSTRDHLLSFLEETERGPI